jgi:hypothetical protein
MRDNFATVSEIDNVPGVGTEAFRAGDKRFQRLVVIQGNILLDIISPKEYELQNKIALFVLKTL